MHESSAQHVDRLLLAAQEAESRGARAIRRPAWYPVGLGVSTGLALASFAVPGMEAAGIVVGAILLPLALDLEARRRTGASPARSYLEPPTRRTSLAYVAGGATVAAIGLTALKLTGWSWVVLPCALILGVWTTVAARRVEQLRAEVRVTQTPAA